MKHSIGSVSLFCLLLAACTPATEKLDWYKTSFAGLKHWQEAHHAGAINPFIRSCDKPKRTAHQLSIWNEKANARACEAAKQLRGRNEKGAREFFETYFDPYVLTTKKGRKQGLLTGYYIPLVEGSLTQSAIYPYPAYGVPDDLRKPYYSREEIENGVLKGKGLELAWFKDPITPFFIQIQGSGRVKLPNGNIIELQYAEKNGHGYTSIGKVLLDRGELERKNISMQSIKQWLRDHPDEMTEVLNTNASYVFFKRAEAEALPVGSQGVPLTPERSLAIDHSVVPYGLPVWLDTTVQPGEEHYSNLDKLMITQDRGGAIKGPLRGDIFFGQGDKAAERAGKQKFGGRWVALIPKGADNE